MSVVVNSGESEIDSLHQQLETFSSIENHTWRALRVSPLFRFQLKKRRTYADALKHFVTMRVGNKFAVAHAAALVYSLRNAPADAHSICILLVIVKADNSIAGCCTILSTVGSGFSMASFEATDQFVNEFTPTRIGLQRGDMLLGQLVNAWLASTFDCNIAPLAFPPYMLISIATEWLAGNHARPLELSFAAPERAVQNGLDSLSLALPFGVVDSLRAATKVVSSHDDLRKNGENLLAAIESHVGGVTHINLASFRLERVSCTVGSLGCDGRVKVHAGHVDRALRSLSQHTMHATLQQSDRADDGKGAKRRRVRDENDNDNETTRAAPVDAENGADDDDDDADDDADDEDEDAAANEQA